MRNTKVLGIGLGAALAIAGGWYLVSPFAAVVGCRNAIVELDADKAENCIDFPALREGLKSEIPAMLMKQMRQDPEMAGNPFSSIGMALVIPMVSAMVDAYVTPAGLKTAFKLAKLNQANGQGESVPQDQTAAASKSMQLSDSLKKSTFVYEDLSRFQVSGTAENGNKIKLSFVRHGFFDWKLSAITFDG